MDNMRSFAIFAHNEEALIAQTISKLDDAGFAMDDRAFILINGCTDNTLKIVEAIAKQDKRIHPIKIEFGDKSNAWNVYVDQLAPNDASLHIFIDGDIAPSIDAFNEMEKAFKEHPEALAVSSLPQGGRKSKKWSQGIIDNSGMPGAMYGFSQETFLKIKTMPLRLPIGLVGDDTILRFLLLRNFDPKAKPILNHIHPVKTAFFEYESLPVNTVWGLKSRFKRELSYARRDLESVILIDLLEKKGIKAMPRSADALWGKFIKAISMQEKIQPRVIFFPIVILKTWINPKFTRSGKPWDK